MEERTYDEIFVEGTSESGAITWEPQVLTKRIAAQSAQFMSSIVSAHRMGSLDFSKSNDCNLPVCISAKLKEDFLLLLAGITRDGETLCVREQKGAIIMQVTKKPLARVA